MIYKFGTEFQGTKEQCIQWLGEYNINDATEKLFLLDSKHRHVFRPYFVKRSKDHISIRR